MKWPSGQVEGLGNSFLITERLRDSVMFVLSDPCKGELLGEVSVLPYQRKILEIPLLCTRAGKQQYPWYGNAMQKEKVNSWWCLPKSGSASFGRVLASSVVISGAARS